VGAPLDSLDLQPAPRSENDVRPRLPGASWAGSHANSQLGRGGPDEDQEAPLMIHFALLWLSLVVVAAAALLVFLLSGEELTIQDPTCTDEDLARLAAEHPDGEIVRKWP